MEPLLKISKIHIEVMSDEKRNPIIKDIYLTLAWGEVLGLIGESRVLMAFYILMNCL